MPFKLLRSGSGPHAADIRASIVLAVYDPPLTALWSQLDAIAGQTSEDWECIIVDDASTRSEVVEMLRTWVESDPTQFQLIERTSNGGIAAATNDGIDAATGEVLTICDHDDLIHPTAIARLLDHFDAHPNDDVVYTDEQIIDADGRVVAAYLKPDYSPRRHLGHHYLAHLVAARRETIGDLRVRAAYEPAQDYDFYLRVIERAAARGRGVGHIAEVLYSWRAIAGSSALDAGEKPEMAAAVERCSQSALDRRGIDASARTVSFDGNPTTSVLLAASSTASPTEVIEVGVSTTPAEVNAAVAATDAAVVVLSPDAATFDERWATPLAVEAVRPDVGVVGPFVVDEAGGTILSVGRVVRPALEDQFAGGPAEAPGPWGAFFVAREVTAVAPWGMAVERAAFEAAGGLATDVGLDAAVAELCVKLAAHGRSALWTPAAVLRLSEAVLDGRARLIDAEHTHRGEVDAGLRRAADRTPGLTVERYDLTGLAHLDVVEIGPYRKATMLLCSGAIDLVTSDVFDTVVTRPVATPSDLFTSLADHLELPAHVTPAVFAQARREAERRARQQRSDARRAELLAGNPPLTSVEVDQHADVAAPECTLDEIWSLMPPGWVEPTTGSTAELDLEAGSLRPIPETIELFRTARDRNIPLVLVSDIYITGAQLTTLLERAGVDMQLIDDVVTSADHRLGKAHGLLERIIAERGVEADRVAHLGDSEIADVAVAEDLGAAAIHLDVPTDHRHASLRPQPLRRWSRSSGTDLAISAAVRSTLIAAGPFGHDPSFQFGAAVAGPALAGFSRWVSDSTAALGAAHTHCLLREGATIAELMHTTAPDGPVPVRLHASRWVTMRAAVVDGTVDELSTALARRADLTADHVADAFACDPERVRRVLGADRIPAERLRDACAALSADDALRSTIVASAAELRTRVARYLHDRLRLDGDAPIVVADVGWGGTIQEGLTRILRAEGIDREVVGLYFALSSPGEQRVARGARMCSYLPNEADPQPARHSRAIAHHADTIERIMTPEIGTLVDVAPDGSPVSRDPSEDPIPPTLRAAQRGLHAVALRLADRSLGLGDFDDPRWSSRGLRSAFAEVIADALTAPSQPLAEALGAWPHDDVAGTAHRSIAGAELANAVRYANVRDVEMLDPAGRSWLAGLAGALNPVLSGHLAAAQAGIPVDRLVPESENGIARLAAFEIGSDLAALQVGHMVAVAPAGWSVLRLAGPVESLRSIRFDAGEHDALVDVRQFSIKLSTGEAWERPRRELDLGDDDITWIDAHPLDERRFAMRPGGHLLVDIEPALAARIRDVEVTAAFRSWRLENGAGLTRTPVLRRVDDQRRRVRNAVRRRLD